jgi:hypothetical protein
MDRDAALAALRTLDRDAVCAIVAMEAIDATPTRIELLGGLDEEGIYRALLGAGLLTGDDRGVHMPFRHRHAVARHSASVMVERWLAPAATETRADAQRVPWIDPTEEP